MKSLSIKTRLVLLVGSLLILLIAAASFTIFRMKAGNESLGSLYNDRVVALEQLKHVADAYNEAVDIAHKVVGVGFRGIARPYVVGYVDVGYGTEGAEVFTGLNYPF